MTLEQASRALAVALCATPGPAYRAANARRTRVYEFGEEVLKILSDVDDSGNVEPLNDILAEAIRCGLVRVEVEMHPDGSREPGETIVLVGPGDWAL